MKSAIAVRGAATTLGGQFLKYVIQMAALVFLARLLAPEDYGLVAMVSAVVGIALVIGDFGLGLSAVQAENLTDLQRDNLFWMNTLIGLIAGAAVFACGPLLSAFYEEPRLQSIAAVLSLTFVFNGMSSQFRAELVRDLKFLALASVDLLAQAISFSLAIVLAMLGAGFWSLVAQQVIFSSVTLVGLIAKTSWRPKLPNRTAEMRSLYTFGASTFGTQVINYCSANVDSVALGRYHGSVDVGLYNRAFQIFSLPLQQLAAPLTRVALPVLSRLQGSRKFARYVEKMQLVLSYSLLGMLAYIASTSAPLIEVVLGKQWVPGAVILEALCLGGVFQALGYVYYWMFLARARMNVLLACEVAGRTAMIALIILAAPRGTIYVALAVSTGLFLTWLVTTLFGVRHVNISSLRLVRIAALPALVFGCCYAVSKLVQALDAVQVMAPALQLGTLTGVFMMCVGLSLVFKPVRSDLDKVLIAARQVVRR